MAERQRVRDDVERDLGTSGSAAGIDDHIRRHPDLVARAVSRLLPAAAAGDQAPPRAVERHSICRYVPSLRRYRLQKFSTSS